MMTFNDPLPSCLRWMQSMWRVLQKVLKPGESYTQPPVWTHLELLWRELEHFNTEMQLRQRCTLSIHATAHWNWEQKDVYQFLFHFLVDKCALICHNTAMFSQVSLFPVFAYFSGRHHTWDSSGITFIILNAAAWWATWDGWCLPCQINPRDAKWKLGSHCSSALTFLEQIPGGSLCLLIQGFCTSSFTQGFPRLCLVWNLLILRLLAEEYSSFPAFRGLSSAGRTRGRGNWNVSV